MPGPAHGDDIFASAHETRLDGDAFDASQVWITRAASKRDAALKARYRRATASAEAPNATPATPAARYGESISTECRHVSSRLFFPLVSSTARRRLWGPTVRSRNAIFELGRHSRVAIATNGCSTFSVPPLTDGTVISRNILYQTR